MSFDYRKFLALFIAALIHCVVGLVLSPRRPNAPVQHQDTIQKTFSVAVYLQPEPGRSRHIADGKVLSPEKPSVASSLSSKRKQKIDAPNQDAKTLDMQPEKLAVVEPTVVLAPSADTSGEIPSRLNIDELKALARQDTKEQARARSGHSVKALEVNHLSNVEQQAIERAQRPKCDNEYKPKVGSVEFSGLMKLPFLLKGAISDQGCKW